MLISTALPMTDFLINFCTCNHFFIVLFLITHCNAFSHTRITSLVIIYLSNLSTNNLSPFSPLMTSSRSLSIFSFIAFLSVPSLFAIIPASILSPSSAPSLSLSLSLSYLSTGLQSIDRLFSTEKLKFSIAIFLQLTINMLFSDPAELEDLPLPDLKRFDLEMILLCAKEMQREKSFLSHHSPASRDSFRVFRRLAVSLTHPKVITCCIA